MFEESLSLNFLFSPVWWKSSFKKVLLQSRTFLMPALILALSNSTAIFCDSILSGSFDLGAVESSQVDLSKLLGIAAILMAAGSIGLATGLIGLSLWMIDLTAFSRWWYGNNVTLADCRREVKSQSKYFSSVWLFGLLYLLGPVMPLSVLIAITVLAGPRFTMFGEPMISLPESWKLPMQIGMIVFGLITVDYTIALTVCSSTSRLRAREAASLAMDIIVKKVVPVCVLNVTLLVLNVCISAPFLVFSFIPALAPMSKNLTFQYLGQLWFGLTSIITWPLSLLIFAEYLKAKVAFQDLEAGGTAAIPGPNTNG